jgi:hypothetical protein
LSTLAKEFGHRVVFAFVYISEAHAADEWPVGHCVHINQPKSTAERIAVAQHRLAELGVGEEFVLLVDLAEENNFHAKYACWPFRWYTVESNSRRLVTIAQPRSSGYDIRDLVSWIVIEVTR